MRASSTISGPRTRRALAALAVVIVLAPGLAHAQEMPTNAFLDWQRWNSAGMVAYKQGKYERAAQSYRLAIDSIKPYAAREKKLMARTYAEYARVLYHQKRYAEAEPLAKWAIDVRDGLPGIQPTATSENLEILAKIQVARRHLADAEPHLRRSLALQEKTLGTTHPDLIPTLEILAGCYADQGKAAEAEPAYRRALELRETHSAEILKKAKKQETLAETFEALASTSAGNQTTLYNQVAQLRSSAQTLRDSTSESLPAVVATGSLVKVLRRAGKTDEADTLEVQARALRDTLETRAARARQAARTALSPRDIPPQKPRTAGVNP